MTLRRAIPGALLAAIAAAACPAPSRAGESIVLFNTPANDASAHRTDSCNCGQLYPTSSTGTGPQVQGLPDLIGVTIAPWQPLNAFADPFAGGIAADGASANFFRMEMKFAGLVNPPGLLGVGAGTTFAPFLFGNNPVYGFFEIDIDHDRDTGGEQPGPAALRYLGNVARFGMKAGGVLASRTAVTAADLNQPWEHSPQVCRSGADWSVVFCGCFPINVVWKNNPADQTFGAGDAWIVEGRFFQRAGGYQLSSAMTGGSAPGLYDPIVKLKFAHNMAQNQTIVTLVYPLTHVGANQAANYPVQQQQPMDVSAANLTSIQEGVQDLILRSQNINSTTGLPRELIRRWANKTFLDVRDPTQWLVTALVGTSYSSQADSLYVWTDCGFGTSRGDVTGDGVVNVADRAAVQSFVFENDGNPEHDADGEVNGSVLIDGFGVNFCLFDVSNDGAIGYYDAAFYQTCIADFNNNGSASIDDMFIFLNAWLANHQSANIDGSNGVTIDDFFLFLNLWLAGCD